MTTLDKLVGQRILFLDGAMGTMLQQADLTADDFGGEELEGCNEWLVYTRPDVIEHIHDEYFAAGADIVETNTFGATSIVLDEYDVKEHAYEINVIATQIAKKSAAKFSTPEWPRFVAGSIGPTTKTLSVTGGTTFPELIDTYYEQVIGLIDGGADCLLVETCQDTLNVKACGIAIQKAFAEKNVELPILLSGTIEPMGTTLAGQNIEAFLVSTEHLKPLSIGLNCATGPEFMKDSIRTLAELANVAVSCYPNAGLPDENGQYHESPQSLALKLKEFAKEGWLNIVGGCCGTTPDHIRALREHLADVAPRQIVGVERHVVSGIEVVTVDETNRPILVGERTNVIGSKKFRELISSEQYESASEIARLQVNKGAQVIDICLANPDRDEKYDMEQFLPYVTRKVKVPLMIDTTDTDVLKSSLTYSQGKAIINSINLEDGEEKFRETAELIRQFGAAVVVGTIDEQGMAVSRERKLAVAERSYRILVEEYGIPGQDIIWDPLTFPVGTGDEQYIGSALETVEGIRLLKEHFPETKFILGVSNVSFGLPALGREVLNAVFLYHCTKAGLDYAIVNTEKLERFARISEEELALSERILFETNDDTVAEFTNFYRTKVKVTAEDVEKLPLEERLGQYVIQGTKLGLIEDLQEALTKYPPLEIINGPLMAGMDEVGRLFNDNQLIVAEVLQSAEVMKTAVSFLEPHMPKEERIMRGKMLLATVKGDVHDIGKNLVEIILGNNGYHIINLGIKVGPDQLIQAYNEHQPDLIGLSGLLVKSAQQMVTTAKDLKDSNIQIPVLVGGAALTRKFTQEKIKPQYEGYVVYAKDAMHGLELANQLTNGDYVEEVIEVKPVVEEEQQQVAVELPARSEVAILDEVRKPIDLVPHVLLNYPLEHVIPYVNWRMLFGKHLGVRGSVEKLLAAKDEKVWPLWELCQQFIQEKRLRVQAKYQFFQANSDGQELYIYNEQGEKIETFDFPRQIRKPHLCLSDYVQPVSSGKMDYVAFLTVTAGFDVREQAETWKEAGEYVKSHLIQALALEVAEATAERVHHLIRDQWGIIDPIHMTMQQRFQAKYEGIRVSFGYPACPNLDDQAKLFGLLQPEEIGVQLTEGMMMEPEASVSALVFSHPEGRYFSVDGEVYE